MIRALIRRKYGIKLSAVSVGRLSGTNGADLAEAAEPSL